MNRVCLKCGYNGPEEDFKSGRNICKPCNRAYHREYKKRRMESDPVFAAHVRTQDREYKKKKWATDINWRERKKQENLGRYHRYMADPAWHEKEQMRGRIRSRQPSERERRNARFRERYHNDPEFREKHLKKTRMYLRERLRSDPNYAELNRRHLEQWASENPERARESQREACRRYYARKRGATRYDPHLNRMSIFERDAGICHICGKSVDPNRWDLDHLVPVSRGGGHISDNVAVSHVSCNRRRGAVGPAQLRLGI